jgi:hypothetical protein
MTLLAHVAARLKSLSVDCSVANDTIVIHSVERPTQIRMEEGWEDAFKQYRKARSLAFDLETRSLMHNASVEYLLVRLAPSSLMLDHHHLKDAAGNAVTIGAASMIFALAFFDSAEYEQFFRARLEKRLNAISVRRVTYLMWQPTTATYAANDRKTPPNLKEVGLSTVKNCLFKVAVEEHDSFAVWTPKSRRMKTTYLEEQADDDRIPRSDYDENVVSYYKVAKASPFPSQSFLAYYHVLEYYFLRVAEDLLHHRLTAMLNDPKFKPSRNGLDKLISAIRGQDARSDETEMLRNVLNRYVQEVDLIEFINRVESLVGEKLYTKKRKIFGEQLEISPREGHALSNAASVLKHVRNAIVHSSDRYNRDECHIPLSGSEETIEEFIPLVRYFAERVIYGTAT